MKNVNMSTLLEEDVLAVQEPVIQKNKNLVLYNDDFNTFQHVIESLVEICNHNELQAEQCAYLVHHTGKCAVKVGTYKKLEPLCTALLERNLTANIE